MKEFENILIYSGQHNVYHTAEILFINIIWGFYFVRVSKCLENYLDKCNTYNSEKILHTAFQLPGYQIYQTVSVRLSDHYKTTALKQTRYIFKPNDKKNNFYVSLFSSQTHLESYEVSD